MGCRRRRPQTELVRVTKSEAGIVVDGPSSGRGAWLCRSLDGPGAVGADCLDAAVTRRAFARAWRVEVDSADERSIRELLGTDAEDGVENEELDAQ